MKISSINSARNRLIPITLICLALPNLSFAGRSDKGYLSIRTDVKHFAGSMNVEFAHTRQQKADNPAIDGFLSVSFDTLSPPDSVTFISGFKGSPNVNCEVRRGAKIFDFAIKVANNLNNGTSLYVAYVEKERQGPFATLPYNECTFISVNKASRLLD